MKIFFFSIYLSYLYYTSDKFSSIVFFFFFKKKLTQKNLTSTAKHFFLFIDNQTNFFMNIAFNIFGQQLNPDCIFCYIFNYHFFLLTKGFLFEQFDYYYCCP